MGNPRMNFPTITSASARPSETQTHGNSGLLRHNKMAAPTVRELERELTHGCW
eukprot:COSAG02_NODE_1406_length_12786_cov_5.493418_2_plen_53_part_00